MASESLSGISEDNQKILDLGLENGIPASEVRYFDVLRRELERGVTSGRDAYASLQEAQVLAQKSLEDAENRPQVTGIIPTPLPEVVLAPHEVALRFWINSSSAGVNQAAWNTFIEEFVAADEEVGQLILETRPWSLDDASNRYDCFYLPMHEMSEIDTGTLTSLDPFMATDTAFDAADFLPSALAQVKQNEQTWAFPLHLQPEVLWYNADLLAQAGVNLSEEGWTVDQFNDALSQLASFTQETPVFASARLDTTVLMLIAAYGGAPFDDRQTPPQANFTTPDNIAAIRQVLDLLKSGLIHTYRITDPFSHTHADTPLFVDNLTTLFTRGEGDAATFFPQGQAYQPFSFTLGAGYISKQSRSHEACYRLISQISQHPDLLLGFPIRYSAAQSSEMSALYGAEKADFYSLYMTLLESPNAVDLSLYTGTTADWYRSYWLLRAMDRYVLDEADLEVELAAAERLLADYDACVASLDLDKIDSNSDYNFQLVECAISVDPTSAKELRFGG